MSPSILTSDPSPASNGTKSSKTTTSTTTATTTSKPLTSSSSQIPAWVAPDLNRLLRVEHLPGAFASRSISLVSLPPNALFARITNPTPSSCAYTSVQASRDLHIELNSDLVYINHSCSPSLIFDMKAWEVRVNPDLEGGLKEGDELTFFYPSSEWEMSQPFECLCGTKECVGRVSGARDMKRDVLDGYWLNEHVEMLLVEKDGVKGL